MNSQMQRFANVTVINTWERAWLILLPWLLDMDGCGIVRILSFDLSPYLCFAIWEPKHKCETMLASLYLRFCTHTDLPNMSSCWKILKLHHISAILWSKELLSLFCGYSPCYKYLWEMRDKYLGISKMFSLFNSAHTLVNWERTAYIHYM